MHIGDNRQVRLEVLEKTAMGKFRTPTHATDPLCDEMPNQPHQYTPCDVL